MDKKSPELHLGHRKRIRERYLTRGIESLDENDVMELLLTYSIPRRDVYGLARRLIDCYGTVGNVLSAPSSELAERFGLSENTAAHLRLINDIRSKPVIIKGVRREQLSNLLKAAEYCRRVMGDPTEETVLQVFLDTDDYVTDVSKISYGSRDSAELPVSRIVEDACEHGTPRVLIAHNHPSGSSEPSVSDVNATETLERALATHGIQLAEHIIVCRSECTALMHHQTISLTGEPSFAMWKEE